MSARLRIGIVGGGLIVQGQHLPNLLFLKDGFEVVGVSDPSAKARAFVERRFGVPTFAGSEELRDRGGLDAVVIASPDFTHTREVLASLERGLHVFCEKPLCYGVEEADAIVAAGDRAGQVGYMKRHDPAYEACLELLPEDGRGLRYVSVEVNDPDAWPFMEPHPHLQGDDVPADLVADGRAQQRAQIERALGGSVPELVLRGFATAYCSALVHDVNAVHGMLDRMRVPDGEVVGAQIFAGGDGGLGTVRLPGGRAVWQTTHLTVPGLADYRERITVYLDDRIVELVVPSPWLNHHPTRLVEKRSDGLTLSTREIRPGFGEAFVRELEAFRASVVEGAPVRNTPEQARRDQALLCGLARHAARSAGA
jgi:predicted dehydrogenase